MKESPKGISEEEKRKLLEYLKKSDGSPKPNKIMLKKKTRDAPRKPASE